MAHHFVYVREREAHQSLIWYVCVKLTNQYDFVSSQYFTRNSFVYVVKRINTPNVVLSDQYKRVILENQMCVNLLHFNANIIPFVFTLTIQKQDNNLNEQSTVL